MTVFEYKDGELVEYEDGEYTEPPQEVDDEELAGMSEEELAEAENLNSQAVADFDAALATVLEFNFQDFNIQVMSANQVFSFCDHEYYMELLPLAGKVLDYAIRAVNGNVGVTLLHPDDFAAEGWLQAAQVMAMVAQIPVFAELLGTHISIASADAMSANFRVDEGLHSFFGEDMSPPALFTRYKEIYTAVREDAVAGLLPDVPGAEGLGNLEAVESALPSGVSSSVGAKTSPGAEEFERIMAGIYLEIRKRFYMEYYPKFLPWMTDVFSTYASVDSTREFLKVQVGLWVVREVSKYSYTDADSTSLLAALLPKFTPNEEIAVLSCDCVSWLSSGDLYAEFTNIRYEHFFEQLLSEFPLTMEPFPGILVGFANSGTQSNYLA